MKRDIKREVEELAHWRDMYKGATVKLAPCGRRALVERPHSGWVEVVCAAGTVILLSDCEDPVVLRDHESRTIGEWAPKLAAYGSESGGLQYGAGKLRAGMGAAWRGVRTDLKLAAICRAAVVGELIAAHMSAQAVEVAPC